MIAAAEAERKVAIMLQLIPDQQNKSVAKSIEDQVNAIEAAITKIAQNAAKKRSEIYKKEAEDRNKFEKQAERDRNEFTKAEQRELEGILNEKNKVLEKAAADEKKQAERRERDQIKAQEMREKRAGKLMVRDAKAQQKARQDEAKAAKKHQEKMTSDIIAAQKMQVESKQKATEAGVAALQGTMDLVEGLAILGLVSEENFEKFARGFSKVQAGFKTLKGFTELVWKGREALIALNSATKAQATANALLSASNNRTAATQGALTASQSVGGGVGGLAMGVGGAALGGLALAAAAGAVAIYSLAEASRQEEEARKQNAERVKRNEERFEKNARDSHRRIIGRMQLNDTYHERRAEDRTSERDTRALMTRVNYELGGGSQDAIEDANNDRLIALREVQAAESEVEEAKTRSSMAQRRASAQLEEANRNLIETDLRRLQVMRNQQKAAEDQVKASREAVKAAQDSQKSELQRYSELNKYQKGRLREIAEKKIKGEKLSERDIRLLEATGQGADIVRDYRSQQGIAAGGEEVLAALSPTYRESKKSELEARDKEFVAVKIEARVEEERRKLKQDLPAEAQRQEELQKKRTKSRIAEDHARLRRFLRSIADNEENQNDPNNGRRNPFEPDPVYQLPLQRQLVQQATVPKRQQDQQAPQQQPAPQRQPEEQPAVDAADQVTQSGIGVEQALKVVLSAVAQNNAQLQASIENSDLMKGYYNV
jgi:hypothetical protein